DRWAHLFVVAAAGSTDARQLTEGDFGVAGITWHPDGRTVAFGADRKPDADLRPATSIWAVDAGAAGDERREPRQLLALAGWAARPGFSAEGRWVGDGGGGQPCETQDR